MRKVSDDSERWLRSNAELYRRRGNLRMARNFDLGAEDMRRLRERISALQGVLSEARDFIMSGPGQTDEVAIVNKMSRVLEENS